MPDESGKDRKRACKNAGNADRECSRDRKRGRNWEKTNLVPASFLNEDCSDMQGKLYKLAKKRGLKDKTKSFSSRNLAERAS